MAERAAKSSVVQAAAGICLIAAVLFLSLESAESSGKLGTCGGDLRYQPEARTTDAGAEWACPSAS